MRKRPRRRVDHFEAGVRRSAFGCKVGSIRPEMALVPTASRRCPDSKSPIQPASNSSTAVERRVPPPGEERPWTIATPGVSDANRETARKSAWGKRVKPLSGISAFSCAFASALLLNAAFLSQTTVAENKAADAVSDPYAALEALIKQDEVGRAKADASKGE